MNRWYIGRMRPLNVYRFFFLNYAINVFHFLIVYIVFLFIFSLLKCYIFLKCISHRFNNVMVVFHLSVVATISPALRPTQLETLAL